jgi:hypothetical protein
MIATLPIAAGYAHVLVRKAYRKYQQKKEERKTHDRIDR